MFVRHGIETFPSESAGPGWGVILCFCPCLKESANAQVPIDLS
jgi:hypothetical protein